MKGVSLLVALATLGVDIGWDAGPSGNLLYTIRIERVLLEPMRTGQAVVSGVDAKDRGMRRFQIVMDEAEPATPPAANDLRVAEASELQYGWQPAEEGGLEYLVQITPERFQRLAKGAPIIGEVLPEVPEVHRFHISVGVGQLPRVGLTQPRQDENQPPSFLNTGDGNSRTGSPYNNESRFGIPNTDRSGNSNRFESSRNDNFAGRPSNNFADEGAWRSDSNRAPDRNSYPPRDNGQTQLVSNIEDAWRSQQTGSFDNRTGTQGGFRDERFADRRYSQRPPGPPLSDPQGANLQQPANYPPPSTNTTAPTQPTVQAPPPSQPNWQQPPSAPPTAWRQPPSESVGKEADTPEPWMPLILTTFALFASLGANAYIGWLAWSFFWRYRQSADDLERARSLATASRQAA